MKTLTTYLLLGLILIGCNSDRTQDPKIFLGSSACTIPCWYGLLPGQTTMAESKVTLASLSFVATESFKVEPAYLFWRFDDQASGQGRLYFDTMGRLKKIVLNPDGVTLSEAVDSFGQPDYVWTRYLPGDSPTYALTLYYPSRGIAIEARDKPTNLGGTHVESISKEMRVSEIRLFTPTSIDNELSNIEDWSSENVEYIRTNFQPWPGFGENNIKIKP
jgi:hypothetical protein